MTRPAARRPSPAVRAALSGAVDLSSLKKPAASTPGGGGDEVTEADFETKVLRRSQQVPVVVALYSQRSPGSVELVESLRRLRQEDTSGSWDLAAVEAEANLRIAQAFGVQGIPAVIAVAAGQPLADFQGVQPEPQLRQWLSAVVQAVAGKLEGALAESAPDERFVQAEALAQRGDLAGAEAAYQAIVDAEPGNKEAKAAVRQMRFLARAGDIPESAIATADADPTNIDAALQAADLQVFLRQPEPAFDRLIALIRQTTGEDRARVRAHLVELFELFDPSEDFVVAARRKLATALY